MKINNTFENLRHDPEKVIFNYSSLQLNDIEKNVLCKGLNFCLPPRKLNYADTLVSFELLYRDIKNLEMNHEERESIKARMKDISFSMYNNYDPKQEENLTADELKALNNLKSRSDIIIQKSDKGNSIVIIDKSSYIEKMESILSDTSKFGKVDLDPGKELNYIINQEKRIRSVLKILNDNGNISTSLYKVYLKIAGTFYINTCNFLITCFENKSNTSFFRLKRVE